MFPPKRFELSLCWVDVQEVKMRSDFSLNDLAELYLRSACTSASGLVYLNYINLTV